ncbi:hypothetical protein RND81_07G183700 [Saponaria officinalis]|uniref:F-box domain-containing protein n=1 Tax=Saponaria officinalis TaxID=3572 RepID=A0AAW1JTC5_SAPOF
MDIEKVEDDNEHLKYMCEDIWFEVRSRLPFKSYLTSRLVCKSWKKIISSKLRVKFKVEPEIIPMFGIFISPFNFKESPSEIVLRYICTSTKRVIKPQVNNIMDQNLIINSGCERGLWSDMSFDFSSVRICNSMSPETKGFFFTISGGLLLVTLKDGTSQVHNPATNQVIMVPKSKLVEKYDFQYHQPEEMTGIIARYSSSFFSYCRFLLIRFCRRKKIMEVCKSSSRTWRKHTISLNELQLFEVKWRTDNYVVLHKQNCLCLFLLAKDRVIAIKFKKKLECVCESFSLPEALGDREGINYENFRISGCKTFLYLFYHNSKGLWIWAALSTEADKWCWLPLIIISHKRVQLCKPVGRNHLTKLVLNPADRVIPLTCHPSDNIVFLLVKSSIFAYHLKKDTIEWIADMKGEEDLNVSLVLPFQPCLSNLKYKNFCN